MSRPIGEHMSQGKKPVFTDRSTEIRVLKALVPVDADAAEAIGEDGDYRIWKLKRPTEFRGPYEREDAQFWKELRNKADKSR